jgi:hypothetical protein
MYCFFFCFIHPTSQPLFSPPPFFPLSASLCLSCLSARLSAYADFIHSRGGGTSHCFCLFLLLPKEGEARLTTKARSEILVPVPWPLLLLAAFDGGLVKNGLCPQFTDKLVGLAAPARGNATVFVVEPDVDGERKERKTERETPERQPRPTK